MLGGNQQISRSLIGLCIGAGLSLTLVGCGNGSDSIAANQKPDVAITLVGYAVPKAAHNRIIKKFAAKWQQEHSQKVVFKQTYGGSGSQTRAVIDGLPADVVHLALGNDINKLVQAKLVAPDWDQKLPNQGIVAKSVVAMITRSGNPKQIKSFADLTRSDVKWVTANPKTSGGARWNFLALWNQGMNPGKSEAQAIEFTTTAAQNIVAQPKDAREAMDAFIKQGQGDALLNYENEIIFANQRGQTLEYVVPDLNISIDTPVAMIDRNVDRHGNRAVVEAFVKYLFEPEAQAEFVKVGYRPMDQAIVDPRFKPIPMLSTVAEYGGWKSFQKQFFADGAIYDRIQAGKKSP
jgi:sulfate/thiosulfate transport system substrate-binding protein